MAKLKTHRVTNAPKKKKIYKICFYVPDTHAEKVKSALFDAGAGKYENYDQCSWQTLGHGQFRPLKGSDPFIGEINKVEKVPEFKVEMICRKDKLKAAVKALVKAHPYEEPAYEVYAIEM